MERLTFEDNSLDYKVLLNAGPMMRLCFLHVSLSAATRFMPHNLRKREFETVHVCSECGTHSSARLAVSGFTKLDLCPPPATCLATSRLEV